MVGRAVARAFGLLALCVGYALSGCGDENGAPSPFAGPDAGLDVEPPESDADADAGGVDFTLGGPCTDREQCDDGIECTTDRCDLEIERCRFEPEHDDCADDVYCDGEEQCEPGLGCREGEPVACSDGDSCTIDRCVEDRQACEHLTRDADGDGDPVWNCEGGDCDDGDPRISSAAEERCGNEKDDDCDGDADEEDCVAPAHDVCSDALEITASGTHVLSLAGADYEYPLSCHGAETAYRDLVVAVVVEGPDPQDVDVTLTTSPGWECGGFFGINNECDRDKGDPCRLLDRDCPEYDGKEPRSGWLSLGAAEQCGDPATETQCEISVKAPDEGSIARLRLRALEPGAYPVYVSGNREGEVGLEVRFEEPTDVPANEGCTTAAPLVPGEHVSVSLVGVSPEVPMACVPQEVAVGDLFYSFELSEPSDVTIRAVTFDDYGIPVLSLRNENCWARQDELTCRQSSPAELYARALEPGVYKLAVSGTGPTDVDIVLEVDPASPQPEGEGCAGAPELAAGTTNVDFEGRIDAIQMGCLIGAPDASFSLELAERSDVLLVGRLSNDDTGSLLIAEPPCSNQTHELACVASDDSPVRVAGYGLEAGSYRVVAESAMGNPIALDSFQRPALPITYVAFADECGSALTIPANGGRFEGNTSGHYADYDAGCDFGGGAPGGAPDQMLRLELGNERRVILDMRGSEFDTLLAVRRGPGCPGEELDLACASGSVGEQSSADEQSFLDLTLPAGTYFVQIDGYDGSSGRWLLDVYIEPP